MPYIGEGSLGNNSATYSARFSEMLGEFGMKSPIYQAIQAVYPEASRVRVQEGREAFEDAVHRGAREECRRLLGVPTATVAPRDKATDTRSLQPTDDGDTPEQWGNSLVSSTIELGRSDLSAQLGIAVISIDCQWPEHSDGFAHKGDVVPCTALAGNDRPVAKVQVTLGANDAHSGWKVLQKL